MSSFGMVRVVVELVSKQFDAGVSEACISGLFLLRALAFVAPPAGPL